MRRRVLAAITAAAVLLVPACSAAEEPDAKQVSQLRGTELGKPFERPKAVLADLAGQPFDVAARLGEGKLTLLYFGYTNCPDVCPTTVADLAAALRKLPEATRAQVRVVMVSSDPARDTPKDFRAWLDRFDPSFTGLTGEITPIVELARSVGIGLDPPKVNSQGDYEVEHGAQVVAFTPDGLAHRFYRSGTSPDDFAHDIPLLLKIYPKEK
ncbi:SCO family protein [Longispora albida]|uniref:SCO family protein n=1 Tax=Longispora albida TaxID=203523 RepID=UPI0003A24DC4|nr:SCO family protein [Longispora albida]